MNKSEEKDNVISEVLVNKVIVEAMPEVLRSEKLLDFVCNEFKNIHGFGINANSAIGKEILEQISMMFEQIACAFENAMTVHEVKTENCIEEVKEGWREAHIVTDNMEPNKIIKTSNDHRGYTEIYAVSYPVQFFFKGRIFDGIEIGPFPGNEKDHKKHMDLSLELNMKLHNAQIKKGDKNGRRRK